MVNFTKYLLILSIFSFFMYGGSNEEIFLRATQCCEKYDWKGALDLYQSMQEKGSLVWYNMGNCYYHLKNYAQALICWKRAERGSLRIIYAQSQHNQKVLAKKLNKSIPKSWIFRLYEFFSYSINGISLLILQILFLCCWFITCFLKKYKSRLFSFLTLIMLILGGLSGVGIMVKHRQANKIGVIVTDHARVFSGPSKEYHILDELSYTKQVVIQDSKFDGVTAHWYKVNYEAGTGWLIADEVQVV